MEKRKEDDCGRSMITLATSIAMRVKERAFSPCR